MAKVFKVVAAIKPGPLKRKATPVVRETVTKFGAKLMDDVGSTDPFNVSSPAVKKYLKNFGAKKITGINNVTRARVRVVLQKATDEGKSTEQIAKMLTEKFDRWSKGRALTIARSEITPASNFGAHEGMRQAGVEEKEWLTTIDNHTRATHEDLDGEVVAVDEPFSIGGLEAMYPGDFGDPAEDVNCRCGVLPVVNDKSLRTKWAQKALDKERKPFDKKLYRAISRAFQEQKSAALNALGA